MDTLSDPHTTFLSTQDLSDLIRVAKATIEGWRSGDTYYGPAHIKLGKDVRYRLSTVLAWLDERETNQTPAQREGLVAA